MLFYMPNIQGSRFINNMLTLSKAIPHPVLREVGLIMKYSNIALGVPYLLNQKY